MATDNFNKFYFSFFGRSLDALRDGPNIEALLQLEGDERQQAEQLLLENLSLNDSRSAVGLGEIRSQIAVTPLTELLLKCKQSWLLIWCDGRSQVDTALALWRIENNPRSAKSIVKVLSHDRHADHRIHAAMALKGFPIDVGTQSLVMALNDKNDLVRHHAASSLIDTHGLSETGKHPDPLAIEVMRKDRCARKEAIERLKHAIEIKVALSRVDKTVLK